MHLNFRLAARLLGAALLIATGTTSLAEDEPDAMGPEPANPPTRLNLQNAEEITVTARKKEESLQDVPLSITAFTADTLRAKNIQDAYDVAANTPNFSFTQNLGRRLDVPNIRGQFGPLIGSTAPNAGFFVDGVYVASSIGSTSTANLERVEVLRGPQSALFGRATFSGAVNYITRRPTDEYVGEANFKSGEDGREEIGGWVSGPLAEDKIYFFAGFDYQKWDGEWNNGLQPGQVDSTRLSFFGPGIWSNNQPFPGDPPCPAGSFNGNCAYTVGDNTPLGGEETKTGTFKLLLTPTEDLEFTLKYERSEANDDHYAYLFVPPLTTNNCFRNQPGRGFRDSMGNFVLPINYNNNGYDPVDPGAGTRSGGWICGELQDMNYVSVLNLPNFRRGVTVNPPGSPPQGFTAPPAPFLGLEESIDRFLVEAAYDWNEYTFTARWAAEDRTSEYVRDLDRSYALGPVSTGLFEGYELQYDKLETYEIRVESPASDRLNWFLGYYYYEQEGESFGRDFTGFSRISVVSTGTNTVTNKAVFGSIDYSFGDFTAIFEGRYASDNVFRAAGNFDEATFDPVTNPCAKAEDNFYSFSPRFIVRWDTTENANIYVSVAEGNKPGGFNFAYFDADVDPFVCLTDAEKATVKEEKAWTWEIGAKGLFFDDRLDISTALFYIDWTNQAINVQECIPTGGVPSCELNNIVDNAGESRVYGAEVEGSYFATDYLTFTFGYGYTDSELEDYVDGELWVLRCPEDCYERVPGTEEFTADAIALQNSLGDVRGNKAPRVPKHSVNFSSLYQQPVNGDVDWFWRNDWLYESKRYSTESNLTWAPAFWNWNMRVGLEADNWTFAFYVNNLTDEKSPLQIQDFPLFDDSASYTITPQTGTIGPTGAITQNAFSILPRQSRNSGVILQLRF